MLLASYHLILEYTPCRYSVLPRVWAPEVTSRKSDHCGPGDVALAAFLVTTGHEKGGQRRTKDSQMLKLVLEGECEDM